MAAGIREDSMNKKKSIISTIILVLLLIVGLSVMLYPIVSNWWNERVQAKAIATYDESVQKLSDNDHDKILEKAHEYNRKLAEIRSPLVNYDEVPDYDETLDITGTGIMGYVTIPKIQVQLPIYHGTSLDVLNVAVGHLQGSSLPVGGASTHSVISAHRGLPSAKLFSDLDELDKGDEFTITVLDEIYTYEVEKILIVKPDEVENLAIIPDKDYVTLMTCTPYGINSHRLLVRAHRVETVYPNNIKVSADAVQVDPMIVVPLIMAPILVILISFWIFGGRKSSRKKLVSALDTEKNNNDDS